jgi:hypothetical protein
MAGAGKSARKDDSTSGYHSHKKRGHERRPVLYAGVLERRNLKVRCVIVDISAKGAKVRTLEPYTGAFRDCVLTVAGAGRVEADVVWHHGVELGLEFREPTDLSPDHQTSSVTEILSVLNRHL